MSIGTGIIYSLLGISVVFAALAALMVIVSLLYKATTPKDAALPAEAAPAAAAAERAPAIPQAPGSAGGVKLYDTPERDAAMVMAIVANQLGKPLNELRFLSIKRIDAESGGSHEI